MRCETTVGTKKRKRLVGVSLNAINYRHGARGEITFFFCFLLLFFNNIFAKYIGKGCMCIATGANNKT